MKKLLMIGLASTFALSAQALECEQHDLLKDLACIKCSLKEATGTNPSDKWIALLGTAAQYRAKQDGRTLSKDSTLKKQVIEMIQAYGFCDEEPADGNLKPYKFESTKRGRGKNKSDIDGLWNFLQGAENLENTTRKCEDGDLCGKTQQGVMSVYGFEQSGNFISPSKIKNFETLFSHKHGEFKDMNAIQRQEAFRKVLASIDFNDATPATTGENGTTTRSSIFSKDPNGQGLKECLTRVNELINGKSAGGAVFHLTDKVASKTQDANIGLCKKMATDCGMGDTDFCNFQTPEQKNQAKETKSRDSKMPDFFKPASGSQGVK